MDVVRRNLGAEDKMWRFQVTLRPKEDQELPAIGRRVRATEHAIAILD
jgi:hypothetical protein